MFAFASQICQLPAGIFTVYQHVSHGMKVRISEDEAPVVPLGRPLVSGAILKCLCVKVSFFVNMTAVIVHKL